MANALLFVLALSVIVLSALWAVYWLEEKDKVTPTRLAGIGAATVVAVFVLVIYADGLL